MSSPDTFDRTYYECGKQAGVSLYENYSWRPEISIPIAQQLKAMYPGKTILDFGCAKGFTVQALREIGVTAYGVDWSVYALSQANSAVQPYLFDQIDTVPAVDVVYAKDVFEHVEKAELYSILLKLRKKTKEAFFIVPLGDDGRYRIPEYHADVSHLIAENESWWRLQFKLAGFRIRGLSHSCQGFKTNWRHFKTGNGFYFCS